MGSLSERKVKEHMHYSAVLHWLRCLDANRLSMRHLYSLLFLTSSGFRAVDFYYLNLLSQIDVIDSIYGL
jgi:hypothetical protein